MFAPGVPRANGQVEVINRSLRDMCAKLASGTHKWNHVLAEVEFCLNNTVNRRTGACTVLLTPSKLLFGLDQRGAVSDNLRTYLESVQEKERNLDNTRQQPTVNILTYLCPVGR